MNQWLLQCLIRKPQKPEPPPRDLAIETDEGGLRIRESNPESPTTNEKPDVSKPEIPKGITDEKIRHVYLEKHAAKLDCPLYLTTSNKRIADILKEIGMTFTEKPILGKGAFGEVRECMLKTRDGKGVDAFACKIVDASDKTRMKMRELSSEIKALQVGKGHKYFIQCPIQFIIDTTVFIILELAGRVSKS
jgi:hypothetical protein